MTDHMTLGAGVGRAALVGAAVGFVLVTCLAMTITRPASRNVMPTSSDSDPYPRIWPKVRFTSSKAEVPMPGRR